jgi:hypothetical protein
MAVSNEIWLLKLHDRRWLSRKFNRYYLAGRHVSTENALGLLFESCIDRDSQVRRLRKLLPPADFRTLDRMLIQYWADFGIARHERWIIDMLKLTKPPDCDWVGHWECLHRACLHNVEDEYLLTVIPLCHGGLWSPLFGEAIRRHRPTKTPLRLWGIASVPSDGSGQLQIEIIWAFSKERIELHIAWSYRQLVWAREIRPDGA